MDKFNLSREENIFLAKKMLVDNIYSSAKIEGINVTFSEIKTILEGVNVSNIKLDDITTILNLKDAWKEILNTLDSDLTIEYISQINYFVSRNESLDWGNLRTGKVTISGTNCIPNIPVKEDVEKQLKMINEISNITLRSLKYYLFGMKKQLFWDGNKRTSNLIANKIMIENGKGIILIKEENILEFNNLLTEYYNTDNDSKLLQFLYNKCIYGIDK